MNLRVGHGYDLHVLAEGRRFVLGGIDIPHDRGLLGHSDADCLTHAICDALLGAAGLPDIGHFFPPNDETFRDIDSQELLRRVTTLIAEEGFSIVNVDSTVVAEAPPRIGQFREKMIATLARSMGIAPGQVGLKATTNEGVDATGRREAVAAYAVCLLQGKQA
jgi:2-C-methyl-D-erythritol 2,4-cyclodiphosphate synthase